jgi:hypothetical protein
MSSKSTLEKCTQSKVLISISSLCVMVFATEHSMLDQEWKGVFKSSKYVPCEST